MQMPITPDPNGDPILSIIERHRAFRATLDNVHEEEEVAAWTRDEDMILAKLFAATPTTLEGLRAFVDHANTMRDWRYGNHWTEALGVIARGIDAVTGRVTS